MIEYLRYRPKICFIFLCEDKGSILIHDITKPEWKMFKNNEFQAQMQNNFRFQSIDLGCHQQPEPQCHHMQLIDCLAQFRPYRTKFIWTHILMHTSLNIYPGKLKMAEDIIYFDHSCTINSSFAHMFTALLLLWKWITWKFNICRRVELSKMTSIKRYLIELISDGIMR